MRPMNDTAHFFGLTFQDLQDFGLVNGFSKYSARQMFDWAYTKHVYDPALWTNIALKNRELLSQKLSFHRPKILWKGQSTDGTVKFLLGLEDQQSIECVLIPAHERLTLCVSSQVGCAIGCTFCHTATQGLKRHLKAYEVVGQFITVSQWLKDNHDDRKITNIVYMGQGEPLHNFDNMKKATLIFMEDTGLNISQRKITLSTSGLVPQIEKLSTFPPVNIAISLHASHNQIRSELMPINKVYDLERLFKAIKMIPLKAHRHITYEYILMNELNDRLEDIEGLARLLSRKDSKINIIPYNEFPGSAFKAPSEEKIKWFQKELMNRGLTTTIRMSKGRDILAACGQLKSSLENSPNLWK